MAEFGISMDRTKGDRTVTATEEPAPWSAALQDLRGSIKRSLGLIILLSLFGAAIGVGLKAISRGSASATAQLMLDPRGFQVLANDLTTGQYDANAAINFVESQMRLITSERVLTKVAEAEREIKRPADNATVSTNTENETSSRIVAYRKALKIDRAERSFIIDVTARAPDGEAAAWLANAVVKAYMEEDSLNRADAARRFTGLLTDRLDELRARLADSESKAEQLRIEKNLLGTNNGLVVEQQLNTAMAELANAQSRLMNAQGRFEQIEAAGNDPSMVATLDPTNQPPAIIALRERQTAARERLAELVQQLGDRHPQVLSARARLIETDRRVSGELGRIRAAARLDLQRARDEEAAARRTVDRLTSDLAAARKAQIQVRALEQEVEANRTLLASFETRSMETRELERINSTNSRIVSVARPPEPVNQQNAMIAWGLAGSLVGLFSAIGLIVLLQLFRFSAVGSTSLPTFTQHRRAA